MIYYKNDKRFLVLVIYMFVMFYLFFPQKAEYNKLKAKPVDQNFAIFFLVLLNVESVKPADQQINFVLP